MKRFLQSLMVACLSFAMVGCYEDSTGPEVPVIGSLTLSQEQMTVGAEGGEYSVDITTEYDYETNVNVDWITVSGGSCGTECCTLNFIVAKNNSGAEREGFITFFCDDYNLSATLTIVQEASTEQGSGTSIPNNQIWYTSSDGAIIEPYATDVFGANIVSNTYENGKGIITFDGDVTLIGDSAFEGRTSLTSITIGNSVTSIGHSAFSRCTSLTAFYGKFASADNRCLIIDGVLNSFAPADLTEYTIPDSVTSIGGEAFSYCATLTSVAIGNSVTSIGYAAFFGCSSLTSVTIGNSVTSIGGEAFSGCSSLTSVTIPDSVTTIREWAFSYCSSLTSVTIGNSVTSIEYEAFYNCDSLTSITIPDGVTSIGHRAFYNCDSLESVTIGNSVTSIGYQAFYYCTALTIITIPDSVTKIGDYAFSYCTSLTSITIPDSVTSIGDNAFFGCTSLTEVYCEPTTPPMGGNDMFHNNASGRKIYVPIGSGAAYKAADYWNDYADYIVGYDF